MPENLLEWNSEDVERWLRKEGFEEDTVTLLCKTNKVNGKCLLALNDNDFTIEPLNKLILLERKSLYMAVKTFQRQNQNTLNQLGLVELPNVNLYNSHNNLIKHDCNEYFESDRITPPLSEEGRPQCLSPEIWKAFIACCYVVLVTWITAFVMVIVHDRVPDMKKYPPLPDIFLDNIPHIPWAFDMCEITGTFLFTVWLLVLLFHKHRFILMRRFFALSGTVFLLRCITMLITSLSVPGTHLQCEPRMHFFQMENMSILDELKYKITQAYFIWRGAGMSIQGVRTCGDYMFSGHTVALTMLNFFITEYTPQHLYFVHTMSWVMNMFGIFFILAAHEHYSIDVFVAFYITSRLFCYYHTLSNNRALMLQDSVRARIWFPLLSFFESGVDGQVPNEYESLSEIISNLYNFIKNRIGTLRQLQFWSIDRSSIRNINTTVGQHSSDNFKTTVGQHSTENFKTK